MAQYLIVAERFAPLHEGDLAQAAAGLATALAAGRHKVAVLTIAPTADAARQPGLARRLRAVPLSIGGVAREGVLFEGRGSASAVHLFVLGAEPAHRGEACATLESAAAALMRDGLVPAAVEVTVGLGETTVDALAAVTSAARLFVVAGIGSPLSADEVAALSPHAELEDERDTRSLLARGVSASTAIVVPSPSAARALMELPALARRASDQPVVAVRFGADEAPHDPATDGALEAHYTSDALAGKAACRRALARRLSLNVGPRTLVVATEPLSEAGGGRSVVQLLGQLAGLDVVVVARSGESRALADQANIAAISQPGKVAVLADESAAATRQLLAGADALLLTDSRDVTTRQAGLALRYGTLPLAPDTDAFADHLVDLDPTSGTGTAVLYKIGDAFATSSAVRRAAALRADADGWAPLVRALMETAPRWSSAAATIDALVAG